MIYFPGAGSFQTSISSESAELLDRFRELDFAVSSGRVFVWPVYDGSYERHDNYNNLVAAEQANAARLRRVPWRSHVGEVIDYLESRTDIAANKTAYIGFSHGAIMAPFILALEERIKAAILIAGGVLQATPSNPFIDNLHFIPRVTQATLVLSGEYDYVIPLRFRNALYELLGTSPKDKNHVVFPIEHAATEARVDDAGARLAGSLSRSSQLTRRSLDMAQESPQHPNLRLIDPNTPEHAA